MYEYMGNEVLKSVKKGLDGEDGMCRIILRYNMYGKVVVNVSDVWR